MVGAITNSTQGLFLALCSAVVLCPPSGNIYGAKDKTEVRHILEICLTPELHLGLMVN